MPFKHNARFRDKFPKAKYAVNNWPADNEYLRLRGDIFIWFDPVLLPNWRAGGPRKRGGQRIYSDLSIALCPVSFRLMNLGLPVPDFRPYPAGDGRWTSRMNFNWPMARSH